MAAFALLLKLGMALYHRARHENKIQLSSHNR
jgi:hypothetical protein